MSLHLYDTATRDVREFVPMREGQVGIYICGLTTQGVPHIGHMRFAVAFDILWRWLEIGHGYDVTLVRNVTDIDDKILRKSQENGRPWWAWSYLHERDTTRALETLGVRAPTYEPRATGHITEMIELMDTLIRRGHAYQASDGSGDVYFDVRSFAEYGSLTHQAIDDMEAAADADPRGKRDPRDFALWKGHKDGDPDTASWPTPYGRGRPGWHLECSAMAAKYLGDEFDIHGGAVDLRFPHHENESAQSHAAGKAFARYWMHNAWLTAGGEKMSKSLGNGMTIDEITAVSRPLAVRYYIGASHYRSTIEYHANALVEAESAVDRIEGFLERALPDGAPQVSAADLPEAFRAAMDDDLNVAGALAVVHDTVRAGNTALDEGDPDTVASSAAAVLAMTRVLGVDPTDPVWSDGPTRGDDPATKALDVLVSERLAARAQARRDRDFEAADAIRDQLTEAGVAVEDTPSGARWSLARPNEGR